MPGTYWERMKSTLGIEPEEEPQEAGLLGQISEATTLDRWQRIYGFAICLAVAITFGFLSTLFIVMPTKFAVLYTFANLFAIASTMFLMGPAAQCAKMFDKQRLISSIIYFASLFATLFCALFLGSIILTLVALIVQMIALVWYCLSYIPFAQAMVTKMFTRVADGG